MTGGGTSLEEHAGHILGAHSASSVRHDGPGAVLVKIGRSSRGYNRGTNRRCKFILCISATRNRENGEYQRSDVSHIYFETTRMMQIPKIQIVL